MRDIGHFIGGKEGKGTSGRQGDVFNPNTGEVQAKVALADKSEVEKAIANAEAAFPAWAATNPQRRARVMFKFLELIQGEYDDLARLLSSEHGKTFADAKGDIQRGLEVVEFACGIPNLIKGEYSEGAGPGIDLYSMRQPLGVVAGITPFNFPAMIPLWKCAPAIACGNCFILKPSERDPSVPMRIAELFIKAGLPPGVLNVVNGDKEAVDTLLTDPRVKAVGFVGSSSIAEYIYATGTAHGKRVQCFGGAKNHMVVMPDADMDQTVDALIGAGYGSAGERCMAVSVAVPVGQKTADDLMRRLIPRVEALKIGLHGVDGIGVARQIEQRRRVTAGHAGHKVFFACQVGPSMIGSSQILLSFRKPASGANDRSKPLGLKRDREVWGSGGSAPRAPQKSRFC